jgi:hypothetical protein
MPDKDINLHVRAKDTEQTKKQIGDVGDAAQGLGKKTKEGQEQAGKETDKTSQKLAMQEKIFGSLKSQVTAFIVATLGIQGIKKLVDAVIARFERMSEVMRELYERALSLGEAGQALEFQTGTKGQQSAWASKAAGLQQAGGLPNIVSAQQMMVSADIAFGQQGGIKNPQIMAMLRQLAPFVGSAQLGGEEIGKVFEFAGAAGIEPTAEAYKDYFAKLQAGFTASKATNFGQFMTGLQKGATGYMAMGGSLDEAIAAFAMARAVTANEALAATLLEQATRLSGGAYAKPRKDIERTMGVKWQDLSMDERLSVLLKYVEKIPEAQRAQKLGEVGFPVELSTQLGKIVSPEAKKTLKATRQSVQASSAEDTDEQTQAYLRSIVGQAKSEEGRAAGETISGAEKFSSWQLRLKRNEERLKILQSTGQDRFWIRDAAEPTVMAMEEMINELEEALKDVSPDSELYQEIVDLKTRIQGVITTFTIEPFRAYKGSPFLKKHAYEFEQELGDINKQIDTETNAPAEPNTVNITNDNSINYYPTVGQYDQRRYDPNE